MVDDDGFVLFLDFKKAFYMLEHSFISCSTQSFGFGDRFVKKYKDDLQAMLGSS